MPFTSDEIAARFEAAFASGRLAHAYLLFGADRARLQAAAERLAARALKTDAPLAKNPDFYLVQPESKSRRIRIEQIRDLGKALSLKAYAGGVKVALLCEVERMCLGGADAANAFLKTLEEPQPGTLLILTSAEPQIVLPTILSRCVRLHLRDEGEGDAASRAEEPFLEQWFALEGAAPLRAYARAALFGQRCQQLREEIEAAADEAPGAEDDDEEAAKAIVEGEYLLARRRLIAAVGEAVWRRAPEKAADRPTQRALRALEELNASLLQNVDQSLAVERAMLAYEGLVDR